MYREMSGHQQNYLMPVIANFKEKFTLIKINISLVVVVDLYNSSSCGPVSSRKCAEFISWYLGNEWDISK